MKEDWEHRQGIWEFRLFSTVINLSCQLSYSFKLQFPKFLEVFYKDNQVHLHLPPLLPLIYNKKDALIKTSVDPIIITLQNGCKHSNHSMLRYFLFYSLLPVLFYFGVFWWGEWDRGRVRENLKQSQLSVEPNVGLTLMIRSSSLWNIIILTSPFIGVGMSIGTLEQDI